mgnify:CR=1 FL=1
MITICSKAFLRTITLAFLSFALCAGLRCNAYAESIAPAPLDASMIAVCALLQEDPTEVKGVASADYVDGVDAYGRSVTPAHGDGAAPKSYRFNFSIDVAKRYMHVPEGVEMHSDVIPLEISPDGQVALGDADRTQEFRALCAEHYRQ